MSALESINIMWLRRDLRLNDNHALYKALCAGLPVLPIFIFDTNILNELEIKKDRRLAFIHQTLINLKKELNGTGSDLKIFAGTPASVFSKLFSVYRVQAIFFNGDYEPYATLRDKEILSLAKQNGVECFSFKDQVIFEKDEILKSDGKPYTVFTPYSKRWKAKLMEQKIPEFSSETLKSNFLKCSIDSVPTLADLGFETVDHLVESEKPKVEIISRYHETRDKLFLDGTSRLSVHLRFGTISIRELVKLAIKHNETYLNELIWREFYMMILWHFPYVANSAFKPAYNNIQWRNNEAEFEAWCKGKTGYLLVDAAMNEINSTGFMHNRARMVVASFLTKHLLIDWRWGEAYFAQQLTDFELSSNNGGWQWAAGTGCDAAPYFRIFNPESQAKKFDPDGMYVTKWLGSPTSKVPPIVDHKKARERALKVYMESLKP